MALASAAAGASAQAVDRTDDLSINAIQVVGTHNSYALPADPRTVSLLAPRLRATVEEMMARATPEQRAAMADEHPGGVADLARSLDYVQLPIEAQLRMGVRSLELDLNPDPKGGAYADPAPYRMLRERGEVGLAPIYRDELLQPGMKVLHVSDYDFRTQCPSFVSCLTIMKQWSNATPGHSPVFVLLEPKSSGIQRAIPGAASIPPFDAASFAEIDQSIRTVLGRDKVIIPDDIRGSLPTLEAAVLAKRWPTVASARGKFIFLFIVPGMNLKVFLPYLDGRPSLEGRMAFVQGKPGMAHAAFLMFDNALTRQSDIRSAVSKGYLVRTRADIDTDDARVNDPRRREAALASGAQIISTDYLTALNIYGNAYHVVPFSEGMRCNHVATRCRIDK